MVAAMGNRGGEDPPAMEAEEAMEAARTVDAMKVVEVVVVAMAAEAAAMWRARTLPESLVLVFLVSSVSRR